jgi:hypothetical protein
MANLTYSRELTALLVIDPYNDFISEGGKLWDRIRVVAEANDCVAHMLQILNAARKAQLRVFYALHRRYRPGNYDTLRPYKRRHGTERLSNMAHGAARSGPSSCLSQERSSQRSIGVPAPSPTPIWITRLELVLAQIAELERERDEAAAADAPDRLARSSSNSPACAESACKA